MSDYNVRSTPEYILRSTYSEYVLSRFTPYYLHRCALHERAHKHPEPTSTPRSQDEKPVVNRTITGM